MPLEELPKPDPGKLNPHFILGEIIDHIQDIIDDFPNVDILELRKQFIDIRNHNVDTEKHVRGFLKAFKRTTPFHEAFEQLDEDMKSRVRGFMDGKPASEVIGADYFHPRASPAAKHHFRLLDLSKKFVDRHEMGKHLELAGKDSGLPIIYEDAAGKKIMEVGFHYGS
jgi:hypothetical protein